MQKHSAGGAYGLTAGLAGEINWDKEQTSESGRSAKNAKLHCTYNASYSSKLGTEIYGLIYESFVFSFLALLYTCVLRASRCQNHVRNIW
jgi:hypothetical protein